MAAFEGGVSDDFDEVMVNRVVAVSNENQMDDDHDPFDLGGLDFQQVFSMMFGQSSGPVNWDAARQLANQISLHDTDDGTARDDPPVDDTRARFIAALVQAAQTNVAAATGLSEATTVPVRCVTRLGWTTVTLDGLRPVLESLAIRMAATFNPTATPEALPTDFGADGAMIEFASPEFMAGIMGAIVPQLFGHLAGSLAGHLAHYALGQYDLPLPIAAAPQLAFVVSNIEQFATAWEVPFDELAYALATREATHAAQRSVPWVRDRLVRLATNYVDGYEFRVDAFEAEIPADFEAALGNDEGDFNPMELIAKMQSGEMQPFNLDPERMLAGMQTDQQQPILEELRRFSALLGAYADVVVDSVTKQQTANIQRIEEALKRHRVERGSAASFVDLMLGLSVSRADYEAATAFCTGVVERSGLDGLNRLWEREAHMPTASEFGAPGLWLARIDLNLDTGD